MAIKLLSGNESLRNVMSFVNYLWVGRVSIIRQELISHASAEVSYSHTRGVVLVNNLICYRYPFVP